MAATDRGDVLHRMDDFFAAYGRVRTVLRLAAESTRTGGDHRTRRYRCVFESGEKPGPCLAGAREETRRTGSLVKIREEILFQQSRNLGDTGVLRVEADPVGRWRGTMESVDPLLAEKDPEWPRANLAEMPGFPYRSLAGTGRADRLERYRSDRTRVADRLAESETAGWTLSDRDGPIMHYLLFRVGARLELLGAVVGYDSYF
ncbi:MAG TPA: hypothetical protein PKD69_00785 [Elusimicrobiota bacterium]|nr:hypothetical protein [Elusimicrobiota bacterium]